MILLRTLSTAGDLVVVSVPSVDCSSLPTSGSMPDVFVDDCIPVADESNDRTKSN